MDGLFVTGTALRDATTSALADIKGAFHVNGYAPNMNAGWRYVLPIDKENIVIVRKLLELGYTEKVFISDDCTALFYKGKVYVISVPSKEVTIGPIWSNDGSITMTDWDFDLVAGITGISLEDIPKDKLRTRDNSHEIQDNIIGGADKNAKYAAEAAVIMGISTFTKSALNHSEITLTFSSSGGNRKAVIAVGNFHDREKFANINYNVPRNTYVQQEDWSGKRFISEQAKYIYEGITGEQLPDDDSTYTLTGTLDERHKTQNVSGYLSYSNEGKLMYTPQTYGGDKAYVATCGKYTGIVKENICDFTKYLSTPTEAGEEAQLLIEKALENR